MDQILKKKPFHLDDESIRWVKETYASMTLEERIGQLFCPIVFSSDETELQDLVKTKHIGGVLYREGPGQAIRENYKILQDASKIPLLTAANLEHGGNGAVAEGTFFGKQMLVAATDKPDRAYDLGYISCSEGAAVGVNWSFAPVVDIDYNFHNPITNVRTYGSDPDRVLAMGKAYIQGAKEAGVATSIKHFPGDGVDERDQHLVTTVNTLDTREWRSTYGKIYQGLIDEGSLTLMAGHIAFPAYEEEISGEISGITPATLSKNILQNLLRDELGFNGMVVTDATPMVGFCAAMERRLSVPLSIEAGCDMFLFNKDLDEDIAFMTKGYEEGLLSETRLMEANIRILATKAALNLHRKKAKGSLVPDKKTLEIVGNDSFIDKAKACADEGVTLVKDTQKLLPLDSGKTPKVLLQILGDFPSNDRVYPYMEKALVEKGFQVTKYIPEDFSKPLDNVSTFKEKYDLVIYVANIETASNKTVSRLSWFTLFGLGNNMPWFVKEVPSLFISLGNPYHLMDAPMVPTFINGYCNSDYVMDAIIEKIMGESSFKGHSPIDPFCGLVDTRF